MTHFCITVRWLDGRYHGLLARGGPPEWPPSPFRLFQALVAGVARSGELDSDTGKALEWLQSRPPVIIAPPSRPGQIITRFVPNNDSDKVLDRQKRLTAKIFWPTIMSGAPEVHYLWPVDQQCSYPLLTEAARGLSCLGWGIDMAYADSRLVDEPEIGKLGGVRWLPHPGVFRDDGLLRVPREGSMADLRSAHESALSRIEHGQPLHTVRKPGVFDRVFYSSAERPLGRPVRILALRKNSDEWDPYPHAKLIHVAGMVRCAAIKKMKGYAPEGIGDAGAWVESFVAGHRPEGAETQDRFSYVPLPSIGGEHADGMIRRVIITAPFGCEAWLEHLAEQLDGIQLEPEGGGEGPVLERLRADSVARRYLAPSRVWATVTPVILPGHDDHKPEKTVKLIERALRQSGVDEPCEFTWSALPNFPHCLTAHKYDRNRRHAGYFRPKHLESLTALHLQVAFEHASAGPLLIGAGRHCGLGVLAALPETGGR
jgi:CRISPR-associated protein Csb2